MTFSLVLFVIYALCTYRLSTLLVLDDITEPLRRRTMTWAVAHKFNALVKWLACVWCVSVWVAMGVMLLAYFCGGWFVYLAAVFAFSAVAGFLSERESS